MKVKKSNGQRRGILITLLFLCVILMIFTIPPLIRSVKQNDVVSSEVAKLYQEDDFKSLVQQVQSKPSLQEVDLEACEALANRLRDADPQVFAALIQSKDSNPVLQQALISAASYNHVSLPEDVVEDILWDTNANTDTRIEMLFYCSDQGEKYSDRIEKVLLDEEIGFYAIREYYGKNPKAATAFADNTLQDYNGTYSQQLQGALWVKTQTLTASSSEKERQEFVSFCDRLIEDNAENQTTKKLILNYLGTIDSWESLRYLIDNKDYVEFLPLLADANSKTICGILEEEPDAQRLEVALRAITYGAKAHFHEALSSNMNNHAAFYANHPDLQSLAEQALSLVQEEVLWMQKYGSQQ